MGNANQRERHSTASSEGDSDISVGRYRRKSLPCASLQLPSETDGEESNIDKLKIPTVFKWTGGGRDVFLSGSFDNWQSRIPMSKSQGDFTTIIELPEGTHEFKFLVDGSWKTAPNEKIVTNDLGTLNNVITVRESDFEVFGALAYDGGAETSDNNSILDMSGSPTTGYSQSIPQFDASNVSQLHRTNIPPTLPPQLIQVLLNKDTPANQCTESILPEPNHVMLNHLYALSIKDGVMAMGSTHRYKKKYVTTLLYKPV